MATIGNLAAVLTAKDAGFSAGLKKAEAQALRFGNSFAGIGAIAASATAAAAVAVAAVAAAGVGGAVALGRAVENQMESIDRMAKSADSLGLTTEAFAGLGFAAKLSGVGIDAVATAVDRTNRTIGDALEGSGEANKALAQIGLFAEDLALMSPDQSLGKIADGLMSIVNPAQRAAAANNLFGRSAREMMPLIAGGSEGIRQAADEAQRFGLAISRIDAAKVEMANDSLTRVGAVFEGLVNQLTIEVAPIIAGLTSKFVEWATEGGRAAGYVRAGMEGVAYGVRQIGFAWDMAHSAYQVAEIGILSGLNLTLTVIDKLLAGLSQIASMLSKIGVGAAFALRGLGGGLGSLASIVAMKLSGTAGGMVGPLKGLSVGVGTISDQIAARIKADTNAIGMRTLQGLAGIGSNWDVGSFFADIQRRADEYAAKIAKAAEGQRNFNTALSQTGDAAAKVAASPALLKLGQFAEHVRDAIATPADRFAEVFHNLAHALSEGLLSIDEAMRFGGMEADRLFPTDHTEARNPGLILADSAQAQLFQYNSGRASPTENQMLSTARQQLTALQGIKRAVEKPEEEWDF